MLHLLELILLSFVVNNIVENISKKIIIIKRLTLFQDNINNMTSKFKKYQKINTIIIVISIF